MMDIIKFLAIGLLVGWIASLLVKGHGSGIVKDIVIGVVGAFVGGFIFNLLNITTYGAYGSLLTSIAGSVILLYASRSLSRRSC
jgi:uncharacterized membrane protein YeaQ/YmgE (transglycosylase-associated protein family)